jgi:metal-sulfur cluster biosynthetic enzyme
MSTAPDRVGRELVLERLEQIADPCSVASGDALGLHSMGLIESVDVDPAGVVTVDLRLTAPSCLMIGFFVTEIEARVGDLPGVTGVVVKHDVGDRWEPEMMAPEVIARRRARFRELELIELSARQA